MEWFDVRDCATMTVVIGVGGCDQGEVSRTFPSRTFREMRGSEKNFSSPISKNKPIFFTANERDSIFRRNRRRSLKNKPLQCKSIIKFKEIRSEYVAQTHEKSEFSNKFQTAFWNTNEHIYYITVFVI